MPHSNGPVRSLEAYQRMPTLVAHEHPGGSGEVRTWAPDETLRREMMLRPFKLASLRYPLYIVPRAVIESCYSHETQAEICNYIADHAGLDTVRPSRRWWTPFGVIHTPSSYLRPGHRFPSLLARFSGRGSLGAAKDGAALPSSTGCDSGPALADSARRSNGSQRVMR